MRIRGDYPAKLRGVLEHTGRFANLLTQIEREEQNPIWIRGRVSELRSVMLDALKAWREGSVDEDGACDTIVKYLDMLHRKASEKLGRGTSFSCCGVHEAITAQGEDATLPARQEDAIDRPCESVTTTLRAAWKDGPEILARVRAEMDCVEVYARALEKRIRQAVPLEDLRAFGREGLLDAARSYNESRGVPFSGWAALRVRNSIIDGIRRWGGVPRRVLRELRASQEENSRGPESPLPSVGEIIESDASHAA